MTGNLLLRILHRDDVALRKQMSERSLVLRLHSYSLGYA